MSFAMIGAGYGLALQMFSNAARKLPMLRRESPAPAPIPQSVPRPSRAQPSGARGVFWQRAPRGVAVGRLENRAASGGGADKMDQLARNCAAVLTWLPWPA